ncbi:S24 family peptidase [Luteimonas fraxinea]|uniref:S24 family peptidase n=1 Tax=Luteimonas fraxinea TaxID=2901869 RepID=A0ABS8UBQ0_9GAMM|nr:S24 family peptidase [Luteimonas fraxinea]MCD9096161.1 S24 family peptidase [Luteimonas fraxinea]
MSKPHVRKITEADIRAASRLKSIWEEMPRGERPTQQTLADSWDGDGEANQSLISQYMNGKIALNYRALLFFARMLGVAPEAIRSDLPEQAVGTSTTEPHWADVQGYAQAIGLGGGPEAQEYAETHKLKFRADSLARQRLNPAKLAVMYGDGESMEPRIRKGDAILFDTSDTRPRDGQLYVIMVPGAGGSEYQVKRCEVLDDIVFFRADNPTGDHTWIKPKRLDSPRTPIKVIGRVRWIGSWEG